MIESKTLKSLEFDKIKQKISVYCVLKSSKVDILDLTPSCDFSRCRILLAETKEALSLLYDVGVCGIEFYDDLDDVLFRAEKGSILSMGELLKIAKLLKSARLLYTSVETSNLDVENLRHYCSLIYYDQYLESEIVSKIISCDTMSDNASEKLALIRKSIKRLNEQIREKLSLLIKNGNNSYLQDNLITIRNDRYVIPVKSGCRGQVSGFIHDQSSTGSTVFIEPTAVFELNNSLKTAIMEEQLEIEKILMDLSQKVSIIAKKLITSDELIRKIDIIYAKAIYAYKTNCTEPQLNAEGVIDIRAGRHPLIDAEKVIPINLSIGEKFNYMLVTGPNTGGKTVTLKLVGLICVMAMSGMYVPASIGSKVSVFDNVFCDVGDEQSIEQSLSTFSSHMKNLIQILENVDMKSLVLIDEIGAGTDPDEGSALARAIIEKLLERQSKGIITTHYSSLKEYAYIEKRLCNASMEFNPITFAPLYRINVGMPGTSNAIEISKMLGLSDDLASRAFELMGKEKINFENILREAEKTRQECQILKRETEEIKNAEIEKLNEIKNERKKLDEEKTKFYSRAKAESRRIINEKLNEADEIVNEIKVLFDKNELTSGDLIKARTLRNKLEDKKYLLNETEEHIINFSPVDINKLKVGDKVYYKSYDSVCTVHSVFPKKNKVEIYLGAARADVSPKDLFFVSENKSLPKTSIAYKRELNCETHTEINVIGYNTADALEEVSRFIDAAIISNLEEVKIIHGKGMKVLSSAIHDYLRKNKQVVNYRFGKYGEGEHGVTFVKLR